MSEPLRTESSRARQGASGEDRDARIEELLLLGLDQDFAGQYDHAINVWTRALFFDRSHARARAYIERARSALAERQRESEELLQSGVAAFQRGDGDQARQLLQAAVDRGAPSDEALPLLQRLDRLDRSVKMAAVSRWADRAGARSTRRVDERRARGKGGLKAFAGVLLALVAAIGLIAAARWRGSEWPSFLGVAATPAASTTAAPVGEISLPLPRRSETALARARALASGGHLRDGLAILESVRPTDVLWPEAERLRADVQRQLVGIALARAPHESQAEGIQP